MPMLRVQPEVCDVLNSCIQDQSPTPHSGFIAVFTHKEQHTWLKRQPIQPPCSWDLEIFNPSFTHQTGAVGAMGTSCQPNQLGLCTSHTISPLFSNISLHWQGFLAEFEKSCKGSGTFSSELRWYKSWWRPRWTIQLPLKKKAPGHFSFSNENWHCSQISQKGPVLCQAAGPWIIWSWDAKKEE